PPVGSEPFRESLVVRLGGGKGGNFELAPPVLFHTYLSTFSVLRRLAPTGNPHSGFVWRKNRKESGRLFFQDRSRRRARPSNRTRSLQRLPLARSRLLPSPRECHPSVVRGLVARPRGRIDRSLSCQTRRHGRMIRAS